MATPFVSMGGIQSKSISDFDPRTLGGCTVWLDAADSNTLFTDTAATTLAGHGNTVARWNDKSGNNYNASTSGLATNVPNVGAVLVRDSVTSRTQLRFGTRVGTITATTNATAISFTGTITGGQNTISSIGTIVGSIVSGMAITGTNIPSGTFIATYDSVAGNGTMTNNATGVGPTTGTISGTTNIVTITLQESPIAGQSLFLVSGAIGGLNSLSNIYFVRYVASYIGTTARVVVSTFNNLSDVFTLTTSATTVTCEVGHSAYKLPDASIPQGVSSSTHFIVYKPNITGRNQFPVAIGSYTGGGLRELNVSNSTNSVQITNNSTIASTTSVSPFASTLMTGMFSNYIISGWNNGTLMTTTNVDLQSSSNTFNTGVGSGLIGTRSNSFPAYGFMSEYIQFNRALQNDERQQVEGYLAWKWGLVQNLPTNHPYYYAKAPQTAFQPTSFPSCALWLDGADTNTITFSGSNVTQWNDKSGNGTNLVSNASFLRPTYNSSERSLNFTAVATTSATVLENTSLSAITSASITVFGVYKRIAQASNVTTFQRLISAGPSSGLDYNTTTGFNISSGSSNIGLTYERNSGALSAAVSTTSPFILSFALNGTASAVGSFLANRQYLFRNGSELANGTGLSNGTAFNLQRIRLGSAAQNLNAGTAFEGYNGTISEVLLFSTVLTPSQVQQVEGYLAWKWNLQGNLPSTHPFNSANYFFNNTRPFSRYFSPTDIDDCLIWIDAADASTVNFTGSNVTSVRDKSGNGNDISNASSILTYTGTINGLNTITCPGGATAANNFLVSSDLPRDPLNHSYFVVCRYPTIVEVTRFLNMSSQFFGHTYSGANDAYIEDSNSVVGGSTQYTFYPGAPFASPNAAFGDKTFLLAGVRQNSVYNIIGNGIIPSSDTNSNGTSTGSTPSNTSSTTYSITPPLSNGSNVGGQLAEVIIYNRGLSTPERQIVEGYLAWKWGIANNRTTVLAGTSFPAAHPYASYPPINMPILPLTKLYKRSFDPADLSPVLWFDPQDSDTYSVNAGNRLTTWRSKGSNTLQLESITGVGGPLITRSTTPAAAGVSQGTGFQFADFSSGGYFQITAARLITSTYLELTLFPPVHAILVDRQVTFSNLTGTVGAGITLASYLPNGSYLVNNSYTPYIRIIVLNNGGTTGAFSGVNGAVEYGNISIASASVGAGGTTLTITTSNFHGLSASPADTVTLNFTAGTFSGVATLANTINGAYTVASVVNSTQITITLATPKAVGALTSPIGVIIFPSIGRGLNWASAITPVTSTSGGTLVCVTHLPRTPVRRGGLVPGFFSSAFADGGVSGSDTTSNGRDIRIAMGNAGLYIRKNASVNGITNTQLTTGFNVMNATFSNTAVTGADIPTGTNGLAVKGWRYTSALSNTNYNYVSSVAATTNLSFAQIRIGGNTEATSDHVAFPINSHWYEGGLGDILFFDRVLTLEERQLLEGWLSQKYGCNNTLGATSINTGGAGVGSSIHPYRLNQTNISSINTLGTPITSQNQISNNLAAWFDAAYSPTLSTLHTSFTNLSIPNDTGIGLWGSRGGFWSQAIGGAGCPAQSVTGRQPRYILNSVNGLPGVRFSGGAAGSEYAIDVPGGSGKLEYMLTTQDAHPNTTIIGVIRPTAAGSGTIVSVNQASPAYGIALTYNADSKITFFVNNVSTNQPIQSDALTNGNAYIVVARRLGTEMLIKTIGTDGTTRISTYGALSLVGGSAAYIRIGNNFSTGSSPFLGDINELMLFRSALSNQAIQHIEGYLAWKWGLQASLPTTHAYKRFSP